MRKYLVRFAFSQYELISANNKEEAKEIFEKRMIELMPKYGLTFTEEDKKQIVVKVA